MILLGPMVRTRKHSPQSWDYTSTLFTHGKIDVLSLSLHTSFSIYDKRCRGYQMVSKLRGTLIIEEELSTQLKSYDQQYQENHLVLSTKSERNLKKTGLKKKGRIHWLTSWTNPEIYGLGFGHNFIPATNDASRLPLSSVSSKLGLFWNTVRYLDDRGSSKPRSRRILQQNCRRKCLNTSSWSQLSDLPHPQTLPYGQRDEVFSMIKPPKLLEKGAFSKEIQDHRRDKISCAGSNRLTPGHIRKNKVYFLI